MLLVALLILVFIVGVPILAVVLARHGPILRIASALVTIAVGIAVGALAFTPASSLPDLPLVGAAVELLLLATLPFSLLLLIAYPLGMIGLGLWLLLRRSKRNPDVTASKQH